MAVESPQRDNAPLEDYEWVTTLHSAARGGDITLIKSLLDEGAEIDEIDPYGKTPLQSAMEVRNKGAALALLARGADKNIRVIIQYCVVRQHGERGM
jgi:ankyrin repeat protein